MDVGVRALKQHLSEYIERASRGELIRITERGQAKALLGPLPGPSNLQAGITEGWIRPGEGKPLGPVPRARARSSIAEALGEDRGE